MKGPSKISRPVLSRLDHSPYPATQQPYQQPCRPGPQITTDATGTAYSQTYSNNPQFPTQASSRTSWPSTHYHHQDKQLSDPSGLSLSSTNNFGNASIYANSLEQWLSQQAPCASLFGGQSIPQSPLTTSERSGEGRSSWHTRNSDALYFSGAVADPTIDLPKKLPQIGRTVANWMKKSKDTLTDRDVVAQARDFATMLCYENDLHQIDSPGWIAHFKEQNTVDARNNSFSTSKSKGQVCDERADSQSSFESDSKEGKLGVQLLDTLN